MTRGHAPRIGFTTRKVGHSRACDCRRHACSNGGNTACQCQLPKGDNSFSPDPQRAGFFLARLAANFIAAFDGYKQKQGVTGRLDSAAIGPKTISVPRSAKRVSSQCLQAHRMGRLRARC